MFEARLRLARKAAGFTMRQLAGRVAPRITAQAISRYEAGKMIPSSDILAELSRNLDVSLDFLMGGQVEAIEFRGGANVSVRDRVIAEICVVEHLERYLMIEAILEEETAPGLSGQPTQVNIERHGDAETLARELRDAWQLGIDPIPDMTSLLESKGFRVIMAELPEHFAGTTCAVRLGGGRPDTHVIVVSSRANPDRQRFSLARELAHHALAEPAGSGLSAEQSMGRFATAFLMPAEHLRQETGEKRACISYPELRVLKHLYGVPAAAMLMRLGQIGILAETTVERAFQGYARDWHEREPNPMYRSETFERPRRFERLVWRSLTDKTINSVRAARLLRQPLERVEHQLREVME